MSKLAFIIGITGQDGSYLTELLLEKGYKVYGNVRRTSLFYQTRIHHLEDKINLKFGDITDGICMNNFIYEIINTNKDFDVFEIYNLSAQSHVALSFDMPEYTSDVDGFSVLKVIEIIKHLNVNIRNKVKFYQAGTSELFGKVLETPQKETTPFNPVSPYAAAKLYAYHLTKMYREGYGMYCVNGILFNHESPRRGGNFVTMKIVNAIKNILNGTQDCLQLGNIYSKRDWGHAKDYVKGMWLMMQQEGIPKDYVLATGETYTVKEFIDRSFMYKGVNIVWEGEGINEIGRNKETNEILVRINTKYYRPCEVDLLLGDPTKAVTELKWEREYKTLDDLIFDMFEGA